MCLCDMHSTGPTTIVVFTAAVVYYNVPDGGAPSPLGGVSSPPPRTHRTCVRTTEGKVQ